MKNLLLIFITLLISTGCYEQYKSSYEFKWATLNSRLIESELLKIAKSQNPYPAEINIDRVQLNNDMRNLSTQINTLTRTARNDCAPDKLQSPGNKQKGMRYPAPYNKDCIDKINSDPLISDLKAQKEKLNQISRLRSKHDSKVREASKAYVDTLIRDYSKNKFDLIILNNKYNILYNKKGVSLDITDAIINKIKSSNPKISIK